MLRNMRDIVQYDSRTGELLDGVIVYCGVKSNPYGGGWIMNSQDALKIISKDPDLTKYALRVFLRMCADLDFENWIHISQKGIAEELNLKTSNVSAAIKQLTQKGILLRGEKLGRSFSYRLNPDYGWKGKVKNLNQYRKEIEEREKQDFRNKHLKSHQNNIDK